MKMSSDLRNLKRELILNFDLKLIDQVPSKEVIEGKWKDILSNVEEILSTGQCKKCYQEIYMNLNELLLYDIPSEIIEGMNSILKNYAHSVLEKFNEIYQSSNYFDNYNPLWQTVIDKFNLLKKILNKFEKKAYGNFQKSNIHTSFLVELKLKLKSDEKYKKFIECLIQNVIQEISNLRIKLIKKEIELNEKNINDTLSKIKLSINLLCDTGLYNQFFNTTFIEETSKFYTSTANEYINKFSLEEYLQFVDLVFKAENIIIIQHLNEISLKNTIMNLNMILIKYKKDEIFKKYYQTPSTNTTLNILNTNYELLQKIFLLFKNIKIEDEIKKQFTEYIKNCSIKIYEQYNKDYLKLFESFILFKNNVDSIISISFLNDEKFKSLGKDYLGKAINYKPNYIADYFSRYIDNLLTTEARTHTPAEINAKIDEFMTLFKLIEAKDAFENFFIKKLANRCLYNLTVLKECQTYLIEQLKNECGTFFVTKSEEMIADISNSIELSKTFNEKNSDAASTIEMNYYVLSNYSWPIDKMIPGFINSYIETHEKSFIDFYRSKNGGKSLTWHLPYSNCEIVFKGKAKSYTIQANGVHAAILLCFTRSKMSNTSKEIAAKTQLDREVVLSFINDIVKKGILIYKKDTQTYEYNTDYEGNEDTIVLINLNKEETTIKEKEEVEERTIEDRKYVIEAYVMKLLKPKKQMKIDELIDGVVNAVKFPCEREFVLSRIKQLIDNRFISEDENDKQLLKYI